MQQRFIGGGGTSPTACIGTPTTHGRLSKVSNMTIGQGSVLLLLLSLNKQAPVTKEVRSEPPKGGRKRKGTGGSDNFRAAPTRCARASGRGLSIPSAFPSPPPPPVKRARGKASATSTSPPVMSSSAMRVETETTAARPEVSGPANFELETVVAQLEAPSLTSFHLVHEPVRTPSSVVEETMPLAPSPIRSPAHPSLSLGDFPCIFAKEGDVEVANEASSAEMAALEAPTSTVSKVEREVELRLEVPS
ncbi:hypothetical protein AMTR_s00114p00139950 [Amborella trichopoda]|uniref:Uncharacterized protein n=1 Tax=Amborella trichopoda TaxID=13333 RepID=W1NUE3_AMBTC|nr:hypothetical protein AMTR_s00114p00139950 [Amborella trichopoda]